MFPPINVESKQEQIPESWSWILDVLNNAHLPNLGLPVRWKETQQEHSLIAFDPQTNREINIETRDSTEHKQSPVNFIYSTKNKTPMPGTDTPAAVRYERYAEPELNSAIIINSNGQYLAPCIAHGDYVRVEALSVDHVQAKSEIMRRQKALVDKLNNESDFADFVMKQEGMNKFFVKVGTQYYGTLFFYELYFNDIDNVWLICDACNRKKSAQDTLDWFKEQWLYGQEFLDYLGLVKDQAIITKTQNNEGLAQVAIEWFWQRHTHYISVTKQLLQNVTTPIQILNKQVDHVIGSGSQMRAERLQASLDAKLLFLESIMKTPGLGMPKQPDESSHSSSDEDQRLQLTDEKGNPIYPSIERYTAAAGRTAGRLSTNLQQVLIEELQNDKNEKIAGTTKKRTDKGCSDNDNFQNKRLKI